VCTKCGKDNQPHYKFCVACASELPPDTSPPARSTAGVIGGNQAAGGFADPQPGTTAGPLKYLDDEPLAPSLQSAAAHARPANVRACPACGNVVPTDFPFCGQCGTRLEARAAQPTRGHAPVGAPGPAGRLILIRPDGSEGGMHPLEDGDNIIGRGFGTLFEADGYLSPRHAELALSSDGMIARDNNSLNGVYIRIQDEEELLDGDVFRLGQELLRFDAIYPPQPLEDGTEILGSPNPGYWGRLAVVVGRDQDGSAFPMFGDGITLGRERGDILFPEDGYVSGQHARISMRDDRYWLTDMQSSNGTFVRIRGERAVPPGSFLLMGQQLFRVLY
jgi:hypothetical protein